MRKLTLILSLIFTVTLVTPSYAKWTKVIESLNGDIFYLDKEGIRKHNGYVYYWILTNYLKPSRRGNLSNKTFLQGDCRLFRVKSLEEHYFTGKSGRGTMKVRKPSQKQSKWWHLPPDTNFAIILKFVCSQ